MQKSIRRVFIKCLLILCCICVLCTFAHMIVPAPHAQAATCNTVVITSNHSSGSGITVYAYLLEKVDSDGNFCGQMAAQAAVITSAHFQSGNLYVYLETCGGVTVVSRSTNVNAGGANGVTASVTTPFETLDCASAAGVFYGTDHLTFAVGTGNFYG